MKYLFIGNRINVLNEMVRMGLNVSILPPPKTKELLVDTLKTGEFDVLVSNGCPFIIPISSLPKRLYVNAAK